MYVDTLDGRCTGFGWLNGGDMYWISPEVSESINRRRNGCPRMSATDPKPSLLGASQATDSLTAYLLTGVPRESIFLALSFLVYRRHAPEVGCRSIGFNQVFILTLITGRYKKTGLNLRCDAGLSTTPAYQAMISFMSSKWDCYGSDCLTGAGKSLAVCYSHTVIIAWCLDAAPAAELRGASSAVD